VIELYSSFLDLMMTRSGDGWITIQDIRCYMELFPVTYREWFPRLMISAQRAYQDAKTKAEQKAKRLQDKIGSVVSRS
jgi:hypothetical protein